LTDTGNAERLVHQFQDVIRYNEEPFKKWFIWNGKYWQPDKTKKIFHYADLMVRKIYAEAANIQDKESRKALGKWAQSSETARKKRDMIFLASADQSITIDTEKLDSNPWLFNVLNYTLDLSSGEPEPKAHDQHDYLTMCAPVNYDPDAKCPKWEKFLLEIFDDHEDLISFIERAAGYSLTGDISEQCLFFCYGTGKNGKTVFLETLKMLMGDYADKASSEMIIMQRYNTIPSDIARLNGKRLIITSEIEENRRLAESKVKDLTGGDTIVARKMYGDWFEFSPTHKLWIYGNHKPIIHGDDTGIWRRMKLIPFTITIPETKRVPMSKLLDTFKKESSGILNWVLQGYMEYCERGLPEPEAVKSATNAYRSEMDIIGQFISCLLYTSPSPRD